MKPDLEELERLEKAATPGPWKAIDNETDCFPNGSWAVDGPGIFTENLPQCDAVFIATMRNALPDLLDYVRKLEKVADGSREELYKSVAARRKLHRRERDARNLAQVVLRTMHIAAKKLAWALPRLKKIDGVARSAAWEGVDDALVYLSVPPSKIVWFCHHCQDRQSCKIEEILLTLKPRLAKTDGSGMKDEPIRETP